MSSRRKSAWHLPFTRRESSHEPVVSLCPCRMGFNSQSSRLRLRHL